MAIGDYSNPLWVNNTSVLNAANMQLITDKINEIDKHIDKSYIKKASNETVNNSNVLQDDNDFNLSFATADAGVYEIDVTIHLIGHASAGIKTKWVVSGGVTALTARAVMGLSGLSACDPRGSIVNTMSLPATTEVAFSGKRVLLLLVLYNSIKF